MALELTGLMQSLGRLVLHCHALMNLRITSALFGAPFRCRNEHIQPTIVTRGARRCNMEIQSQLMAKRFRGSRLVVLDSGNTEYAATAAQRRPRFCIEARCAVERPDTSRPFKIDFWPEGTTRLGEANVRFASSSPRIVSCSMALYLEVAVIDAAT